MLSPGVHVYMQSNTGQTRVIHDGNRALRERAILCLRLARAPCDAYRAIKIDEEGANDFLVRATALLVAPLGFAFVLVLVVIACPERPR
jgi:hypothetical protein